jgi:hypothetical protein
MSQKVDVEDVKMDMTPMIDVVFLLIIFFLLMPPKEMEGQLQSYLPSEEGSSEPTEPQDPKPTFKLAITAEAEGQNKVVSSISFNQRFVCDISSWSIDYLEQIYLMPEAKRKAVLEAERKKDELRLDPLGSKEMRLLVTRMEDAALGAPDGRDTDVLIDAAPNVPFKIILAVLNAGAAGQFMNMKFTSPSEEIWATQ